MTRLPFSDISLARALNLSSLPIWSTSDRPESTKPRWTATCGASALGRVAKSDYAANFVNLVEEKWSGEVKLDGYGTLVVFNDTSELISSQAGPRNF